MPKSCHWELAESWKREVFCQHLEVETAFNKWIYCLIGELALCYASSLSLSTRSTSFLKVSWMPISPSPRDLYVSLFSILPKMWGLQTFEAHVITVCCNLYRYLLVTLSSPLNHKFLKNNKCFIPSTHTQTTSNRALGIGGLVLFFFFNLT